MTGAAAQSFSSACQTAEKSRRCDFSSGLASGSNVVRDASCRLANGPQVARPRFGTRRPPTGMILIITSGRSSALRSVKTDLESQGVLICEASEWTTPPDISGEIDLVIVDPAEGGAEPTSVLHQIRAQRRTPILVVSRRLALEQRISLLEGGADQVIEAPYDPHELLARIHAIRRRRSFLSERTPGPGSP